MRVCVLGLWHLGTVTAACLAANGHDVTGLDFDASAVAALREGRPPLFEPGLDDLVKQGLASARLRFTTDPAEALRNVDVVWITFDTPVDEDDRGDVDLVVRKTAKVFPHLSSGTFVLISSQIPVGTTRRIEELFAAEAKGRVVRFGYSPENLRLGHAIASFMKQEGIVGIRSAADRDPIIELLRPITAKIEWMRVESAEMTKHARNGFLATSVAFTNEIGRLCEEVGADATEVERGLKMDARIGPQAYVSPGAAFAGGTLARDVVFLSELGNGRDVSTPLISSVKSSNDAHRQWPQHRLAQALGRLAGATVGLWGLTYKPGTDTLRRSDAVELCRWLHAQGTVVQAHDPVVRTLPSDLASAVRLTPTALEAVDGVSALVLTTPWPEYRKIAAREVAERMKRRLVLDAGRFLADTLGQESSIEYLSVGNISV